MTTFYADDLTDGQGGVVFLRILKRWKGSLYKLVWIDLLIYISAYYVLNLSYRFGMNDSQKRVFEEIVEFCEKTKGDIPISFLLGFFVAGIIGRWYHMYMYIPWMNEVALHVANSINGRNEAHTRKIRITIMRYINLAWILMMRLISDQIASRFDEEEEFDTLIDGDPDGLGDPDILKTPGPTIDTESNRPTTPKRRPPTHRQRISRNTCHPWTIAADDVMVRPNAAPKTPLPPPPPTPTGRHTMAARTLTEHLLSDPNSPTTPLMTPLGAPLATNETDHISPDAFQAEDDPDLRKMLVAFNGDKQVKRTFGILITESEIAAFQRTAIDCFRRTKAKYQPEYWVPIQWAQRIVLKAVQSGYILDPKIGFYLIGEIGDIRKQMQNLQIFSSIMIPLVYTQVVIIAVYSYFLCQIFACQFVEQRNDHRGKIDLYIPIFSIFSFLFLMGWLKVALCVMNPFGDDDEDFQTSSILDYNLEVSFRSVYMEGCTFPENLSFPLGKKIPEDEPDDLQAFLEDIDCDLNRIRMDSPVEDNVCNLEMQPSRMTRCKQWFCCKSKQPKDVPKRAVTRGKYGIKFWAICDSKTSYALKMDIYKGKEAHEQRATPLGTSVVLHLRDNNKESGRNVTSLTLGKESELNKPPAFMTTKEESLPLPLSDFRRTAQSFLTVHGRMKWPNYQVHCIMSAVESRKCNMN